MHRIIDTTPKQIPEPPRCENCGEPTSYPDPICRSCFETLAERQHRLTHGAEVAAMREP